MGTITHVIELDYADIELDRALIELERVLIELYRSLKCEFLLIWRDGTPN